MQGGSPRPADNPGRAPAAPPGPRGTCIAGAMLVLRSEQILQPIHIWFSMHLTSAICSHQPFTYSTTPPLLWRCALFHPRGGAAMAPKQQMRADLESRASARHAKQQSLNFVCKLEQAQLEEHKIMANKKRWSRFWLRTHWSPSADRHTKAPLHVPLMTTERGP